MVHRGRVSRLREAFQVALATVDRNDKEALQRLVYLEAVSDLAGIPTHQFR